MRKKDQRIACFNVESYFNKTIYIITTDIEHTMKKIIFFLMLIAVPSISTAAVSCNGVNQCSGLARELIDRIFPATTGGGQVLLNSPEVVNGLPCTGASGGPNVSLLRSSIHFEETYALLLVAFVGNEEIQIRIDSGAAACTVFYIALKS